MRGDDGAKKWWLVKGEEEDVGRNAEGRWSEQRKGIGLVKIEEEARKRETMPRKERLCLGYFGPRNVKALF